MPRQRLLPFHQVSNRMKEPGTRRERSYLATTCAVQLLYVQTHLAVSSVSNCRRHGAAQVPDASVVNDPTAKILANDYSITSSARASSDGGTVRPSALAVLRLIANSYLVGACTGRSAAFSPLRMRST